MDDILIFADSKQAHNKILRKVLKRLENIGMTLNEQKTQICVEEIQFVGHIINKDGIRPDKSKVAAIVNLEAPTDQKELLRFLGMVNFVGRYIPNKADIMEPLNCLLTSKNAWIWDTPQEEAFNKIKELLTRAPSLAHYDCTKPTFISADASSYGLGCVLLQEQDDKRRRPVAYASRTLTSAERRYAQIEREALAFTYACEKFSEYITGLHVEIETDHKPLIPIFSTKHLDDLSPRLQRSRIRMMCTHITLFTVLGKN